jgi:hypothetical protein
VQKKREIKHLSRSSALGAAASESKKGKRANDNKKDELEEGRGSRTNAVLARVRWALEGRL